MKKNFLSIRYAVWIMLTLLLINPGFAERKIGILAHDQETGAQPENVIVLHVTNPDGEDVTASVVEGGAFSIEDQVTGERIIFIPSVSGTNRRNVNLNILKGTDSPKKPIPYSTESMHIDRNEELIISLGSHKEKVAGSSYTVEIVAIIKRSAQGSDKTKKVATDQDRGGIEPLNNGGGGDCCIFCNGKIYCSNCAIWTPCGCCHTDFCSC